MNKPKTSFEWYLRNFYHLSTNDISDDQIDKYRIEFNIWQDASDKDKEKMWPTRAKSYADIEECN